MRGRFAGRVRIAEERVARQFLLDHMGFNEPTRRGLLFD